MTDRQASKLARIAKHDGRLPGLLNEQLGLLFQHSADEAVGHARRQAVVGPVGRRYRPFLELYHRLRKHLAGIVIAATYGFVERADGMREHEAATSQKAEGGCLTCRRT